MGTEVPDWNQLRKRCAKYGLSIQDYQKMLEEQDGRCGMCYDAVPLDIDHSHTTDKVRGLLCRHCNLMLGHAKESVLRLQWGIEWLELHSEDW